MPFCPRTIGRYAVTLLILAIFGSATSREEHPYPNDTAGTTRFTLAGADAPQSIPGNDLVNLSHWTGRVVNDGKLLDALTIGYMATFYQTFPETSQ